MKTPSCKLVLSSFVFSATLFPFFANSAELGDFYNLGKRPTETAIRAGAAVVSVKNYDGSNDQKTSVLPGIFLQTTYGIFADPLNGVGYSFEPQGNLQYGVRLNVETGRSVEDALSGFEKIKARLNPGVYANYVVNDNLTLQSALRLGVGDGADGSVLHLAWRCCKQPHRGQKDAAFGLFWWRLHLLMAIGVSNTHIRQNLNF